MIITLITLFLAAAGFVWGKIRADIMALIALLILTLSGIITTGEALSGFSNPIVIMMIGLFVVGGAIFNTGLAKMIGARLLRLSGDSPTRMFMLVMGGTALIGAFVSNTGTVALMLPIVVSMAGGNGVNPSRLLMPLAFASSLGGMMTLIGTPPNIVIAEVWEELGNTPLGFFSFLPAGAVCLVAGTLLLIPLSKFFLSGKGKDRNTPDGDTKTIGQLVSEYELESGLYGLIVSENSEVAGHTLAGLDLRGKFGIDVLEVRRGDRPGRIIRNVTQHAAQPDTELSVGETLFVRGSREAVERCAARYGLAVDKDAELQFYDIGIAEIVPLPQSAILNNTVSEIGFRTRYDVNVIGVRRKNRIITSSLSDVRLRQGDVLLVQGAWEAIARLNRERNLWVVLGQPLQEAAKVTLDYKAPLAALIMLAMIVAMIFDIVPAVVAVLAAAVVMILTGCFRNVEDAYKTINWESAVLIAAMMPMSFALEKTGVSELVAGSLVESLGQFGPVALLAGVFFTTSIMTLFISNTATAVLMAPIAVESAVAFGVSPLPFLFAVTYGASLCFASPFSTPPNALVMPAGQYTFIDYIKVGLPLQLLLGVLMIFILPLFFPF
ncbi:MAG: SLC13 family permease [Muribaculaceae bacterium]|nr:SLC13 family permease [Muribaculaceae bacterium]